MQQRQLRLGDVLDDYCPRERRVTNHAIVAMVGPDVKQTRCTTCDTEHEYKHAKVPRQRRKLNTPAALYSQVVANAPKRIAHDATLDSADGGISAEAPAAQAVTLGAHAPGAESAEADAEGAGAMSAMNPAAAGADAGDVSQRDEETAAADDIGGDVEEGPVHRPLIRATLPRPEGTPPPTRPAPEFTIRQPGGRQNRFRARHGRGPQQFQGNRGNGNVGGGGPMRSGSGIPRQGGGRPPQRTMTSRLARRNEPGPGRKRSK